MAANGERKPEEENCANSQIHREIIALILNRHDSEPWPPLLAPPG
jgi:hypothetical protein